MKYLLSFFLGFILFQHTQAQFFYDKHSTHEKVEISYKWDYADPFDKTSAYELRLKLKNKNNKHVLVSFSVDYYLGPTLAESAQVEDFCLVPNGTASGKLDGVYFASDVLTNEELKSPDFRWELNDIKIEMVKECPKQYE